MKSANDGVREGNLLGGAVVRRVVGVHRQNSLAAGCVGFDHAVDGLEVFRRTVADAVGHGRRVARVVGRDGRGVR